ncbi:MAG: hypothetical protein ABH804_02110 [archaeon]
MVRKLGHWRFMINCLFATDRPLSLDNEFWEYIYHSSESAKKRFPDINIERDRYGFTSYILRLPHLLKVDRNKKTIELDKSVVDEDYLYNLVNYSLDKDIKDGLPQLLKEVYQINFVN